MQELWGYHVKYTQSSIKEVIRYSLFKGIKKTIMARDKYLRNKASIYFRGSNNEVKQLFESTHAEQVKFKLLNFYVANRITITGLTYIIKELNKIFRREEEEPIIDLDEDEEEPKVELAKEENVVPENHENVSQAREPVIFEREEERDPEENVVKEEFNEDVVPQAEEKDKFSEMTEE